MVRLPLIALLALIVVGCGGTGDQDPIITVSPPAPTGLTGHIKAIGDVIDYGGVGAYIPGHFGEKEFLVTYGRVDADLNFTVPLTDAGTYDIMFAVEKIDWYYPDGTEGPRYEVTRMWRDVKYTPPHTDMGEVGI